MLSRLDRLVLNFAFNRTRSKRLYEPVEINGRRLEGKRESSARWQAISEVITSCGAKSVLDIGCSEGWFLRRAAEDHGCFALGIDAAERRVLSGELSRLHDGVDNIAIMKGRLGPNDIRRLPVFDVVLCLSVAHHLIRDGGLDAAEKFITALSTRARKALVFEMGTSEEKKLAWTSVLPPMAEGQESFVRAFLERCGLTDVKMVGDTESLKKDARRLLFVARISPLVEAPI